MARISKSTEDYELKKRLEALLGAASAAWPIGAVFVSVVSTNPNTLLGYGTWSAIAAGRVLVGLDSGDTDFDTVKETGGAKTATATATAATPDLVAADGTGAGVSVTGSTVQPYYVVYLWERTA